ncbi:2-phosphosulfolactate phosphatase [Curtobacterium sp. PsM8]|uniref:2-phosphosulfolactate phosphatase n=1 Tax=Curtobacterium sp. PsM8 TaxID=3030532 RepID=UPI00263B6F24|nr:2-phosphosulfolactate phosphatase [Curtobacterium sp. PsM8]MDN4649827.1 2-phosphosulfolactate phosphatase [Curtobacterium sp. PsM8]
MQERGQRGYQVRFGWGAAGAARIAADAHLLVWVDVLPAAAAAAAPGADGTRAPLALLPDGPEVVLGHLGNVTAVAERVLRLQADRGDRCVVAVVAAGHVDESVGGGTADDAGEFPDVPAVPEFAVEDLLAAGAVVDALVTSGVDHTSPEAAAACAAWTGLRQAATHLVTASESAGALDVDRVHAALAVGPELVTLRPSTERA